ncbi:hypothetical protein BJX63DRAFT_433549 [Aspergillus granulosus]|uniref:Uncharacterized protein n=1 Tax=Aspergillus granulosus TaxID=176169 RepID=A0ABR4H8Z9_9EURO
MTSLYTGPGLLYVGSRTKPSTDISNETYNKWYDDIHVPDVLETSGVQTAVRYIAAPGKSDDLNWPFLAVYPISNLHYLTTEEFANIPSTDRLLPGPSHSCLDCAEFDQRHYATVGKFQVGESSSKPSPKLLVVHFDYPTTLCDADPKKVQDWYFQQQTKDVNQQVQLYKLIMAHRFKDNASTRPALFIALHRLLDDKSCQQALAAVKSTSASVAVYDLWKEFGQLNK